MGDRSSEQFHSVNTSFLDFNNKLDDNQKSPYVCCRPFQAISVGQISLHYMDLVKVVYAKGEFCLVHHQTSQRRGYVPKTSISKLTLAWISNESLSL